MVKNKYDIFSATRDNASVISSFLRASYTYSSCTHIDQPDKLELSSSTAPLLPPPFADLPPLPPALRLTSPPTESPSQPFLTLFPTLPPITPPPGRFLSISANLHESRYSLTKGIAEGLMGQVPDFLKPTMMSLTLR